MQKREGFLVIANPASGSGRGRSASERVRAALDKARADYEFRTTTRSGDAMRFAERAVGRRSAVICIGGDGTIHEAAQPLVNSGLPLGIIPAGTGNDFARMLNLPRGIEARTRLVLGHGGVRVMDAGKFEDRIFINVLGMGFDAAINHTYSSGTGPKGVTGYLAALARTYPRFRPFMAGITLDGKPALESKVFMLTVGNGTTCGGGFRLTPKADPSDGHLDLTVLAPVPPLPLLWHLPKAFTGNIDRVPYSTLMRFGMMELESEGPLPVHLDGEPLWTKGQHAQVRIIPEALSVITSREP